MLVLLVVTLLVTATGVVHAIVPYSSYVYDEWARYVPAPQAYVPSREVSGLDLGVGNFKAPNDICVGPDGSIFILDTGNNRIIQLSSDWELVRVLQSFDREGVSDRFNSPQGLCVSPNGDLYVADTGNGRVLHFSASGAFVKQVTSPTGSSA